MYTKCSKTMNGLFIKFDASAGCADDGYYGEMIVRSVEVDDADEFHDYCESMEIDQENLDLEELAQDLLNDTTNATECIDEARAAYEDAKAEERMESEALNG